MPSGPDMLLRTVQSTSSGRLRVGQLLLEAEWVVGKWYTANRIGRMSRLLS